MRPGNLYPMQVLGLARKYLRGRSHRSPFSFVGAVHEHRLHAFKHRCLAKVELYGVAAYAHLVSMMTASMPTSALASSMASEIACSLELSKSTTSAESTVSLSPGKLPPEGESPSLLLSLELPVHAAASTRRTSQGAPHITSHPHRALDPSLPRSARSTAGAFALRRRSRTSSARIRLGPIPQASATATLSSASAKKVYTCRRCRTPSSTITRRSSSARDSQVAFVCASFPSLPVNGGTDTRDAASVRRCCANSTSTHPPPATNRGGAPTSSARNVFKAVLTTTSSSSVAAWLGLNRTSVTTG
mmetsp:Transcript_26190/g.72141  ORF Transcript_26190/g.72141 Transcript_26190/m.72141 type:complete len:303 (-) Transcript_26190:2-910(-)|eukprot:scaffold175998_cov34-Tisochrysis_lutea.AAC.1